MPARQEKIRELLQMASCGSVDDIQHLYKETIAEFIESSLKAELEDALGYSQYDYKNKDIDSKLLTMVCMKITRPRPTITPIPDTSTGFIISSRAYPASAQSPCPGVTLTPQQGHCQNKGKLIPANTLLLFMTGCFVL